MNEKIKKCYTIAEKKEKVRALLMKYLCNADRVEKMMGKSFEIAIKLYPDASVHNLVDFINCDYSFSNVYKAN